MDITTAKKIAKLARIEVSEQEAKNIAGDLSKILNWIEQLQEVDTDNVEPMAGIGNYTLRMEKDEISDGNIKEDILKNSPKQNYDCFVVPKVVE